MIRKTLRKWLGIVGEPHPVDIHEETRNALSVLGDSGPSIMAYRIANGYIVRTFDRSLINQTMKMPVLTYCKNHTEIAEHLIAESARTSLGVGHQYEMYDATGNVIVNKIQHKLNTTS